MMQTHEPSQPGASLGRARTTRRTLLRTGLAATPMIVLGAWGLKAARSDAGAMTLTTESGGVAALVSQALPSCVVTPQLTEGPYFVDELLMRSDIRSDPATGAVREGVPLRLAFRITRVDGDAACTPLTGALVDVWQCDALGVYSDVSDPGFSTRGQ
jgi:protocatechuate 3,4-dioxygenase beta subunit